MTQSLPKLTAFQSEHCIGWITIVRRPIWHPIHRRTGFARTVPAQNPRVPLHQMKKQSCAKKWAKCRQDQKGAEPSAPHSLPPRDFLIATQSRTSLTSVSSKAITALATTYPSNRTKQRYRIVNVSPSVMGRTLMLKKSNRRTRVRKMGNPGRLWVSLCASNDALANLTGGFPATVTGSPSRDRNCRRNCMSLPGVDTPKRKFDGNCPHSATQLLPLKKLWGMSSWRSVKYLEPQSSMFVKQLLDQKTWESALASSGTRLNMRSHSEPPTRGKRMPASARRYCPVTVQVHSLWMLFIICILYMRRAPLSPREG